MLAAGEQAWSALDQWYSRGRTIPEQPDSSPETRAPLRYAALTAGATNDWIANSNATSIMSLAISSVQHRLIVMHESYIIRPVDLQNIFPADLDYCT